MSSDLVVIDLSPNNTNEHEHVSKYTKLNDMDKHNYMKLLLPYQQQFRESVYDVKTHIKLELSRAHTPCAKLHDLH